MPPKAKGLSVEEKKQKVLDWLLKTGEIVSNKTLESTCSKATGVHSMIIKDIIGQLVSDDLVCQERIGGSTYYWAFKSAKTSACLSANEKAKAENNKLKSEIEVLKKSIEDDSEGREDTEERRKVCADIKNLKTNIHNLSEKLDTIERNDPKLALKLKFFIAVATGQYNIWVDNTYQFRKTLVEKNNLEKKVANKLLGVTDDFDYLNEYPCPEQYEDKFKEYMEAESDNS